ncbi:MAG: serine hydrolase domain-containing protein [Saprospiraceae bacterium]
MKIKLSIKLFLGLIFWTVGCNKKCFELTFDSIEFPETVLIKEGEKAMQLHDFFVQKATEGKWFQAIIWENGNTILNAGYGYANWLNQNPINSETAFDLASISKMFTATAIMKAAEMGLLSINDPITKYIDNVPSDKQSITIHHLLNHSSGLPEFHDKKGDFEKMNRKEALDKILNAKLAHPVGDSFKYSNSAYTLLALILEKASNQPYESFVRDKLWTPIGLDKTGFHGEKIWQEDKIAMGYGDECHNGNTPSNWEKMEGVLLGNSGIVSSADDLLKWYLAWRNDEILNAESQKKMLEKYLPNTRYEDTFLQGKVWQGYSWEIHEDPLFGTAWYSGGSSNFGFISMIKIYPEKNTIVILLSNNFSKENGTIRSLSNIEQIENILF